MPCTPYYHDTTYSPVGLWQLSGSLLDSSGNNFTLTVRAGSETYTELVPGFKGFHFPGLTQLEVPNTFGTALYITGALTVEFICVIGQWQTTEDNVIVTYSSGSALSNASGPRNALYEVYLDSNNVLAYLAERGSSGTNITFSTVTSSLNVGTLYHVAMVRGDDSQVKFYVNGSNVGTSSGLLAPQSGSISTLSLGMGTGATTRDYKGGLASVKIVSRALTDAEVNAEYLRTIGECCSD